jgi:hypothetical protein
MFEKILREFEEGWVGAELAVHQFIISPYTCAACRVSSGLNCTTSEAILRISEAVLWISLLIF